MVRPPELRLIDLATGSSWRVVEQPTADRPPPHRPTYEVSTGRISAEAAREAAWFMLLTPTMTAGARVVPREAYLPVGFLPRIRTPWSRQHHQFGGINEGPWIEYQWSVEGRTLRGSITWYSSMGYAETLVESAQDSWVTSCADVPPPPRPSDHGSEIEVALWDALEASAASHLCPRAGGSRPTP